MLSTYIGPMQSSLLHVSIVQDRLGGEKKICENLNARVSFVFTSAFAHVGVVSVWPSSSFGYPNPVHLVAISLDRTTDVLTLKVT